MSTAPEQSFLISFFFSLKLSIDSLLWLIAEAPPQDYCPRVAVSSLDRSLLM